jgi:hypothetical protein
VKGTTVGRGERGGGPLEPPAPRRHRCQTRQTATSPTRPAASRTDPRSS